jgi:hypothetical protein
VQTEETIKTAAIIALIGGWQLSVQILADFGNEPGQMKKAGRLVG